MKQDLYAQIFDNVYKKSSLEGIVINLETLLEKVKGNKKVTEAKLREDIEKSVSNPFLKNLLEEQIDSNNLSVFTEKSLTSLIQKIQAITDTAKVVDLSIALPLTEADTKEIADILEDRLKKKVILNLKVDPNLIAGVVMKQDKYLYDASLRSHLKEYENEWIKSLRKTRKEAEQTESES